MAKDLFDTLTEEKPQLDLFDEVESSSKQSTSDIFDTVQPKKTSNKKFASKILDALKFEAKRQITPSPEKARFLNLVGEDIANTAAGITGILPGIEQSITGQEPSTLPTKLSKKLSETLRKTAGNLAPKNQGPIEKLISGEAGPAIREGISKILTTPVEGNEFVPGVVPKRGEPITEETITKQSAKTGKVPYADIFSKVLADTISENVPTSPSEVAMFALIPEIQKGAVGVLPELETNLGQFLKERVLTKGVKVPISAQDIRDFYVFGKEKLTPEAYDLLQKIPKEEMVKMAREGVGTYVEKRVPRFGKQKIAEPIQEASEGAGRAPVGTEESAKIPSDRVMSTQPAPPQASLKDLGPKANEYIKGKFPIVDESLRERPLTLTTEELHQSLFKATSAGEEVLLRGGTPEEANLAALKVFAEVSKPSIVKNTPAEFIGYQEGLPGEAPFALYNIPQGRPNAGSTVDYATLVQSGIPAPNIPTFQEWKANLGRSTAENTIPPSAASMPEDLPTLQAAKEAAQQVLKTNKIDDQVMVNLVNQIAVDDVAFKKGYGQPYQASEVEIQGVTWPRGVKDRFQSVIELANGADVGVGRHEAFHAVSNILLDANENKIITDRFGDMEKAADAFAEYRATGKADTPLLERIFNKIQQFLERIKNYFKNKNFKSADDIFSAIEKGQLKGKGKLSEGPQYKAVETPAGKSLENKVLTEYGETGDLRKAGFVMPSGKMVDFTRGGDARLYGHHDAIEAVTGKRDSLYDFIDKTKALRVVYYSDLNGDNISFQARGPLSTEQLNAIRDHLIQNKVGHSNLEVVNDYGKQVRSASIDNPEIEDISKFFNGTAQYKAVDKRLYGNQIPGEPPKDLKGFNEGNYEPGEWDKFLRNWYDRMQPIKYAKGKEIAPLFAQAGGKYTKAYVMARELPGKIRGISESILNELNRDIKPLKNYEDRLLLNRIYSLRNYADLDRIGKTTSGITEKQANDDLAYIKEKIGKERFERISEVADKLASLQNNKALQILVDAKVITPQAAIVLRNRYPTYLRSEILDDYMSHRYPEFKRTDNGEPVGKINRSFLKEKEGTEQQINEDVLDVIRRSLITKVSAAQKQLVVDQIAQDFGKEIGGEKFADGKILKEVDPTKIPQGWVQSSVKASGGRIFAVNEEVANLLEGLNAKEADFITQSLAHFNRYFRAGATTLRVPFVFNNIFRDVQTALMNKRFIPGQSSQIMSYAKGSFEALKQALGIPSHVYEDFIKAGAAYGGQVSSVPKEVEIPFRLLSPKQQIKTGLAKAITLPIEVVSKLAEFSENTSRLAEWLRVQKTELPIELKALQPRDLTVDFEKSGDMMKKVNQIVPFLNANAQGNINNIRLLRDQPGLGFLRTLMYAVVPTVVLYEWNKKHKNDDLIDPYIKNNYWTINTGIEANVGGKKLPLLLTIRKGEYASIISYFTQALLEKSKNDPNFKQKLKDFTMQGGIDNFVSTLVPPIARVPIEEAANRNFFTGRPIITQSIEKVEPKYQFKPGTTDTARRIGEKTGLSPARLEHVSSGLFPATGQILEASDVLLKPEPPIKREKKGLFPLQSMVPVIRTPSGFFSQEEAAAQDFEKQSATKKRTNNYLYENAYRQYVLNPSEENGKILNEYADRIDEKDKRRIVKKVNEQESMKVSTPEERAFKKLPKYLRNEYRQIK